MLSKHTLKKLVSQGLSQQKIADYLDCSQAHVQRSLIHHDLKTKYTGRTAYRDCIQCHKTYHAHNPQQKYCSHTCQRDQEYHQYITRWLDGTVAFRLKWITLTVIIQITFLIICVYYVPIVIR